MTNELKNLLECSEKLGLPPKWLKQQVKAKNIPCLKIGKKHLFNLDAVRTALAELAAEGDRDG